MNKPRAVIFAGLMLVAARCASAQQAETDAIEKLTARAAAALVRLEYMIDEKLTPPRRQVGQAVCIDAGKGWFLTLDIPRGVPLGELDGFVLMPAGQVSKRINAKYLGTDPETGLSFLAATEPHGRTALKFSTASNLKLGQRICSVGLLGLGTGNAPYSGVGRLGAKLRLPARTFYVTAGDLTIASSPVLAMDGRVVGIVGGQRTLEVRMLLGNRWGIVPAAGRQATKFFIPVEEFAHVLKRIPPSPKETTKLAWTGVFQFRELLAAEAELRGMVGKAAVVVKQLQPGGPAEQAGVRSDDVIVAAEGKPLENMGTPELTRQQFGRWLLTRTPGQTISLTLLRKGRPQPVEAKVKLEPMPTEQHQAPRHYDAKLGFIARDIVLFDRHVGRSAPLLEKGVVVLSVLVNSVAHLGKLAGGDLITAIDRKPVPDVAALKKVLEELIKGAKREITFVVLRQGQPQALTLRLPAAE